MTRNKSHALLPASALALCAVLLGGLVSQARTQIQIQTQAQTQSQGAPSPVAPTQKITKTHFMVVHMFPQSLQVSSLTNPRDLQTFDYDPKIREKMIQMFNSGAGFQYGDHVTVWYHQNTDVAVKIRGKAAKKKVTATQTK